METTYGLPLDVPRNAGVHLVLGHVGIDVDIGVLESWNPTSVHPVRWSVEQHENSDIGTHQPSMNRVHEQSPTNGPRRGEDPTTGMAGRYV